MVSGRPFHRYEAAAAALVRFAHVRVLEATASTVSRTALTLSSVLDSSATRGYPAASTAS
jgi:hypothetical protein